MRAGRFFRMAAQREFTASSLPVSVGLSPVTAVFSMVAGTPFCGPMLGVVQPAGFIERRLAGGLRMVVGRIVLVFQQMLILFLELANLVVHLALILALCGGLGLPLRGCFGLLLVGGRAIWRCVGGKAAGRQKKWNGYQNRQHEHIAKSHGISSV